MTRCTCSIGNPPRKRKSSIKECPVHGDEALQKKLEKRHKDEAPLYQRLAR